MTADGLVGFGPMLRELRLAAGLSQHELAQRAALSVRAISNLERGATGKPFLRTVALLGDALGLDEAGRDQLFAAARADGGPRQGAPAPKQLPATVSRFTGRTRELTWLSQQADVRPSGGVTAVISTIGGTAGVGKTELAVRWAHEAAEQFPDGQLFVNLRGYDPGQPMPAEDALAGFLRALGVPGQDVPAELGERAARYRSLLAGRRMLVVLDNAGSVDQVRPLLPGSPGCVTLVTSRDSLAGLVSRDGARRLDLDLLPPADAVKLLADLIGARAVADPASVEALATQCCRLPLALRLAAELAAARPAVPLASLVAELAGQRQRLDLFDAGGDSRTAVRAVFSWSYDRLDPGAARAFRMAGLHPGGDFDAYALAALTGTPPDETERDLLLLARAYLIQSSGHGRYGLHDLLCDYARELAGRHDGEAECAAALTRLFDHYLYCAATAMDTLFEAPELLRRPRIPAPATAIPPLTRRADARAWLDVHRATLAAVSAHTTAHGWPGHAVRLSATLFRYLEAGGHSPEAYTIHDCAQRAARQTGDRRGEAAAQTSLGLVYFRQDRFGETVRLSTEAAATFCEAGDRWGEACALITLAVAEYQQGQHEQGVRHCQRSFGLFREISDGAGEARALMGLCSGDLLQGHHSRAAARAQQALTLFRAVGDQVGETRALASLGILEQRRGRYQEAADYMRQVLALSHETDDQYSTGQALYTLGVIERAQGRYREAASYLSKMLTMYRELGSRSAQAMALTSLGIIDTQLGRHRRAAERHLRALALLRETGDRSEALALVNLGDAFLAAGQASQARPQYTAALGVASRTGDMFQQARAHDGLGRVHHALGDPGRARDHWQQALARYAELGVPEADHVRSRLA